MKELPVLYRGIIRIILLSIAYFVTGKLSLLLAIPPGFATAIFLPIGIAMGAVLIWGLPTLLGVIIGSTLLNLSMAGDQGFSLTGLRLAFEIACGSAAAVLVGTLLIRRYVGFPNSLTDERQIFLFLLLGGPVATIASASIGVWSLWENHVIPGDYTLYSWMIWWVGDAIGVLIAAPLMCVLFAEPRRIWRSRIKIVALPVVVSCCIVVAIFVRTSTEEQNKLQATFHQQTKLMTAALNNNFKNSIQTLTNVRALFIASTDVNRQEFSDYINNIAIDKQGLSVISWNKMVRQPERAAFEQKMHNEGFYDFQITDQLKSKTFSVADVRDFYVVVTYIEPWQVNKLAEGFDAASEPLRKMAIDKALETGRPSMTKPIQLVQDQSNSLSALIFLPVYKNSNAPVTYPIHYQELQGCVTAALRITNLLETTFSNFDSQTYKIRILDITEPQKPIVFYDNLSDVPPHVQSLIWQEKLVTAERTLDVTIVPTQAFLSANTSSHSWFVLAGGLLFSSLLGGFLLLISGRNEHVNNVVEVQTKELASILESAVESIFVVNHYGVVLRSNSAAEKLFKLTRTELLNSFIYDLIPQLADYFLEKPDLLQTGLTLDTTAICQDKSEVAIELSLSRVEFHDRLLFTFIIHDITERRKVDKLKSEFISTVSHELRTPLTSIKGALGIMQSGAFGEFSEPVKELLVITNNNADRLARLVNDILDIDKLEFGNLNLSVEPCEIYPLLQQAIAQNAGYAAKYSVQLQLELPQDEYINAQANVDAHRFLQVMSNLISNAVKFSNAEGIVNVRFAVNEQLLTVSVIDQGAGIPLEFRKRVFQKFAQADSSDKRKYEGTGLGLSITKVIIEQLGGQVNFISEVGKGTTFFFTLPRIL